MTPRRPFFPQVPDGRDYTRLEGEFRRLVAYMFRLEERIRQLEGIEAPGLNNKLAEQVRDRVRYLDNDEVLKEYIVGLEQEIRLLRKKNAELQAHAKAFGDRHL